MKDKKLALIIAIVSAVLAIGAIVTGILIFLDKKKKKEEAELDDYLENAIQ